MPRQMSAQALERLGRLLAAMRTAEQARLADLHARIAACRARAVALRQAVADAVPGAADAAGLGVALRWQQRLGQRARDEEARARELEGEAVSARRRLARALGREQALARLREQAAARERRWAERRAEMPPAGRPGAAAQSSPSGSDRAGASAGSPGMA